MSSFPMPQCPVVSPASFQLAKFSFATVSGEGVKPIPWTHIPEKGHLFAVFEGNSLLKQNNESEEEGRLKVLAEHDVVEDLNLIALGREAINAARELNTSPSAPKFPRVTIIVQEPCVAVRFPLQFGQVRRFQIKFKLGSDFYKALALFSQAGCPLTQAGSHPQQAQITRPHTASSAIVSGTIASQPQESPSSAPFTAVSSQRTPVPAVAASTVSPSRSYSSLGRVLYSEPRTSVHLTTPHDTNGDTASSAKFELSPFSSALSQHPTVSDLVLPQHDKRTAPSHEAPTAQSLSSSDPVRANASMTVSSAASTSQPALPLIAARPSTAPACVLQSLQQMLPPKRELPFKVPSTIPQTGGKDWQNGPTSSKMRISNSDKSATAGALGCTSETEQDFGQEPSVMRRTAPTRRATRATRGSRNGATASSSCKKSSVPQNGWAVPSVEELLCHSQGLRGKISGKVPAKEFGTVATENDAYDVSAALITSAKAEFGNSTERDGPEKALAMDEEDTQHPEECSTAHHDGNIETQALLARVDERLRRKQNKRKDQTEYPDKAVLPPSKRTSRSARLSLLDLPPSYDKAEKPIVAADSASTGKGGLRGVLCAPEPTPADNAHGYNSQGCDENRPPVQKAVEEVRARPLDLGQPSLPGQQSSSNPSSLAKPSRPQIFASLSMMALMNDPDFAKTPEIAQWADLPSEERDAALETWICEQLQSESFATLLKTLEGMWQRVFLGG